MPIWSTADVHPRDRVAYWVDGLSGAIAHVDCEPRRDEPVVMVPRDDDDLGAIKRGQPADSCFPRASPTHGCTPDA